MSSTDLTRIAFARQAAADGSGRRWRELARITQAEAARPTGLTTAAVQAWETGRALPAGDAALRYADVLDELRAIVAVLHPELIDEHGNLVDDRHAVSA